MMDRKDIAAMIVRSVLLFAVASSLSAQVTYDRLLHPEREPQNWLTYSGAYNGNRYSPLNQINRANVKNLQLKWVYHPIYASGQGKMENTPLVVDGVLYTGTQTEVVALDAVTGRQYWKFDRPLDPKAYYNAYMVNKGLAVAGDTVFWATLDCHLYALDVKNGRVKWEVVMADYRKGYQFNVAPLVVRNMIILGPATNEAGANCWVNAYDVNTGKEIWKFYTSPMSADQPEAKTWAGDSWKHGGSPIWNGGAYDPETNLTFWGTGNPNPGWSGDVRAPGDNLWSDSVVALDADTGKLKWYFQFTPGDEYDWDATQVPVLANIDWKGQPRKVMLWANRNGFYYMLDRQTGKFLLGKNFVKQNWAVGLDENGRPVKDPGHWPKPMGGVYTEPFVQGGTNWYPPSFSPHTGLFYIPTWENSGKGTTSPKGDPGPWVEGERYEGTGRDRAADGTVLRQGYLATHPEAATRVAKLSAEGARGPAQRPARISAQYKSEEEGYGAIRALDPKTGEKVWDFHMVAYTESGVLSTGGDVVFGGGMDGDFVGLDAKTGELLWGVYLGGPNASGPISYAVNGKQYIIGTGAGTMYAFALPD
jgi:alcohol dehydrogenase (cytochrome c)